METGLVTVTESQVALSPEESIANASKLATAISSVIEKQKLYTLISGKKYVRVDAFIALGNIQGIFPKEIKVIEHEDGTYESTVELIDKVTGRVIGGASAICGVDEPMWKARPKFARRSMATTRAVGKAFRIHHAWILALANYETTPSEEMEHVVSIQKEEETYQGTPEQKSKLTAYLKSAGFDDEKTQAVLTKMVGKTKDSLKSVLAEL